MPLDNGGQLRFMLDNLLLTGVKTFEASSQDVNFPLSNVLNNFRARPLKFTGRFEITSSNNKLYYNDGTDKVATIPVGEYTSRASLASAIQAQMAGFTVIWDGITRSFKISGPSHILKLSNQTNAIWLTIGFIDLTDTASATMHVADECRLHWPYEFIKVDFGYYPNIGFFGLIADSSKDLNISNQAKIFIEANTIDDFNAPAISIELERTDRGVFKFFDDDDYLYRFWRLRIEDNFNPNEIEIGYLYLGEYSKFKEHYNDQGGINSNNDRTDIIESESGQIYSFTKAKQRSYESIALRFIDNVDKDYLKHIFNRAGLGNPFFISIDPKLEITTKLDDATFFAKFDDVPRYSHVVGNRYNTDFKIKEWL